MRVASLVSGGKDSIYASMVAAESGWDVTHYVTVRPRHEDPLLFHRPNVGWVGMQAKCAGVEHVTVESGEGDEAEVEALRQALSGLAVDGVTSGALASEYQRTRIERVCQELGLKSFMPLWHHDPAQHVLDVVRSGIEAVFVHVAAQGLDQGWLGRRLDAQAAARLYDIHRRHGINPAGEGGEYETFVVDAPHFSQRIRIEESDATWKRDSGTFTIRRASLAFKTPAPVPT